MYFYVFILIFFFRCIKSQKSATLDSYVYLLNIQAEGIGSFLP